MRVQQRIIEKALQPALLIDTAYYMPMRAYHIAALGFSDLTPGVRPEVKRHMTAIRDDVSKQNTLISVMSVNIDKIFADKTENEKKDLAFDLITEFAQNTGYMLASYIDRKRHLKHNSQNKLVEIPMVHGPRLKDEPLLVNDELVLVCDFNQQAKGSFIAMMLAKGYLTEKDVDAIPALRLGSYAHIIPAALEKMTLTT